MNTKIFVFTWGDVNNLGEHIFISTILYRSREQAEAQAKRWMLDTAKHQGHSELVSGIGTNYLGSYREWIDTTKRWFQITECWVEPE